MLNGSKERAENIPRHQQADEAQRRVMHEVQESFGGGFTDKKHQDAAAIQGRQRQEIKGT